MKQALAAFALFFSLAALCAAQAGKVETLGALTDSSVPEAVRNALDAKGYRVVVDDGSAACELWLR